MRPVPASWLAELWPGGRLVTMIAGTGLILTADKIDDGGATGRIEWDRAGFMVSRQGLGYPPPLWERNKAARDQDGEEVSQERSPVLDVMEAWELWSMITALAPGVEHHYSENGDLRTAWMLHPDGSWAGASAVGNEAPVVSVRVTVPSRFRCEQSASRAAARAAFKQGAFAASTSTPLMEVVIGGGASDVVAGGEAGDPGAVEEPADYQHGLLETAQRPRFLPDA